MKNDHNNSDFFRGLEEEIRYSFSEPDRLIEALTHSSYSNERKVQRKINNERIEFLGDAVLSLITAEFLFLNYQNMPEGELSKLRARLVCTESLSLYAKSISLGSYLLLGRGEEKCGGRERASILENSFEALCGAIYLDGGYEEAKKFVVSFLSESIKNHNISFRDYKTALQEVVQQNPQETLNYVLINESGPDHDKRFEVEVHLNSNVIGTGVGKSKKQAEQEAAKEALQLMGL